jgi:exonuclease SbcD
VKLLHFSDLHLGVENYGRLDPDTGLNSRLADFLRAYDRVVDYAVGHRLDLVVFAGDAYKTRHPNPTYQREFASRIQRLAGAGVQVFLLAGNHDKGNIPGRASTLGIFATLGVEGVHVAEEPGTWRIKTGKGDVQVVALPWVTRSRLLTRDEYKNKSPEETSAIIVDKLTSLLKHEIAQLDPAVPTVLAAHGAVQGAVYGSERSVMLGQEIPLPLGLVSDRAFNYVALGHIHRHQLLRDDPPVVYSGSLERIDFGEEKEDKGFVVAEIGKGKTAWSFHSTEARRFTTVEVTASGQDPMPEIEQAIAAADVGDAIVRTIIHLTVEQEPLIDDARIRKWLSGAAHVAAVARDVDRPVRMRLGGGRSVEEMTPSQLLGCYLEAKHVDASRIDTLTRYARAILAGDDGSEAGGQ